MSRRKKQVSVFRVDWKYDEQAEEAGECSVGIRKMMSRRKKQVSVFRVD